ncbi:hypothetical protein CAMGR0001_1271 [Campylobacter gracilis RM3268]|uniref:Uncharacterized protein n=1 Tax=Campylobacter gracilis RM3268 TaxID=553220 RepID=C8PJ72_9BACT|nr:hypothetical protein CAMGR0001_1271 [Campylobacter gracilis RM3268]
MLKSFRRGSFSLRNDKSILKCHLCAFADKILPSFQSELCHFSKLRRYAISLILDGRIVFLNLKSTICALFAPHWQAESAPLYLNFAL